MICSTSKLSVNTHDQTTTTWSTFLGLALLLFLCSYLCAFSGSRDPDVRSFRLVVRCSYSCVMHYQYMQLREATQARQRLQYRTPATAVQYCCAYSTLKVHVQCAQSMCSLKLKSNLYFLYRYYHTNHPSAHRRAGRYERLVLTGCGFAGTCQ